MDNLQRGTGVSAAETAASAVDSKSRSAGEEEGKREVVHVVNCVWRVRVIFRDGYEDLRIDRHGGGIDFIVGRERRQRHLQPLQPWVAVQAIMEACMEVRSVAKITMTLCEMRVFNAGWWTRFVQ